MKKQKVKRRTSNQKLEKVGDYFKYSIKNIFGKNADKYLAAYIRVHWREIVGKNLARNVFVRNIVDNELFLYAKHPAWIQELMLMQDDFISKVNAVAGKNLVKSITFRKAPPNEEEKTKQIESSKEEKVDLESTIRFDDLTKSEKNQIINSLSKVADEDLKKVLERYAVSVKKWQNYKRDHFKKCEVCGNFFEGDYCVKCRKNNARLLELRLIQLLKNEPYLSLGEVLKVIPEVTPDFLHKVRMELARQAAKKIKRSDGVNADTIYFTLLVKGISPAFLTEDDVKDTLKRYRFDLASPYLNEKRDN